MSDSLDRLKSAIADPYAIREGLGAGGMAIEDDSWIVIPCSVFQDDEHKLDEATAAQLIQYVASRRR